MPPPAPLAELYASRAEVYAEFGNGVVADAALRLLPEGGAVLDVGCASGGLLRLLRPRAGRAVGLELSAAAAAAAEEVADEVVVAGIDDPDLPFAPGSFDLVVLADVVEHLVDPAASLRRAASWCRPGGSVLVSVPNIAHWAARATVVRGRWPQEESGTFDAGHLRFFTIATLRETFAAAGLPEPRLEFVVPALRNHLPLRRLPDRVAARMEAAWQAAGRRRPGLAAYQLVAVSSPA